MARKLPTIAWYRFGTATLAAFDGLTLKTKKINSFFSVIIHEYITQVHYNNVLIDFIYLCVNQWENWGFPQSFWMFQQMLKTVLEVEPQVFFSGLLLKSISLQ